MLRGFIHSVAVHTAVEDSRSVLLIGPDRVRLLTVGCGLLLMTITGLLSNTDVQIYANKLFYHRRIRLSHPPHHDNTTCIRHHTTDS